MSQQARRRARYSAAMTDHDDRTEHGHWTPEVSQEADRIMEELQGTQPDHASTTATDKTRLNSPLRQKGTEERED